MAISFRLETPADYTHVETLTREAFWNLYQPGCNEHYIINHMRGHADFLPELSFVMESEGAVIGSIFYSRSQIVQTDGTIIPVLTFGPVSVSPTFQHRGFGEQLIHYSIEQAKNQGYLSIVIGGYYDYYRKFGFERTKKFGIQMGDGNYYTGILALPLVAGALDQVAGIIEMSSLFDEAEMVAEEVFAAFDAQFPIKEKQVLPSQERFAQAVQELDETMYE